MIIKIKSRKKPTFRQLLEYILHDKDKVFDSDEKSFIIAHNLKGRSIDSWVAQYKENEQYRKQKRSDSIILTHEILSWHRQDIKKITVDKLEEMANEYIRLRNPMGMYVVVPHFNKEHYHIHICASGIEYRNGKSMRMSKREFQELKKNIQEYQINRFPELSRSVVEHGKKDKARLTDKEYQYRQRAGRASDKGQLLTILNTCYKRAVSNEDFFERVKEYGLKIYNRSGKITGVVYNNRKYRLKRLGFIIERIKELNINEGLKKIREKKKDYGREL